MEETQLNEHSVFRVRESVILDFILGFVFLTLFLTSVPYVETSLTNHFAVYDKLVYTSLIPAIIFIVKGIKNQTSILINKNGIYYRKKIVTTWENLIDAYITQDSITGSIQDNFVLMLEYCKKGEDGYFIKKIRLTNTQDKSEEEILDAIKFFVGLKKKHSNSN